MISTDHRSSKRIEIHPCSIFPRNMNVLFSIMYSLYQIKLQIYFNKIEKPRPADNLRKYENKQIPQNKVILQFKVRFNISNLNCKFSIQEKTLHKNALCFHILSFLL